MLDFNAASKNVTKYKPADPFNLVTLAADLEKYKPQVEELRQRSLDHQVTNATSNEIAIEMGMQVKRLNKQLVAEGKRILGPYDAIVKGIKTILKPFSGALGDAEQTLKMKISRYRQQEAELARRIAQKKAQEEAEQRRVEAEKVRQAEIARMEKDRLEALDRQKRMDAEAEAAGVESVVVDIPEVVEPPPVDIQVEVDVVATGPVRTEEGTASNIMRWKHRLVDIDKVPADLLVRSLNDKAVREAIKAGVREIPGIEIYEDMEIRFRAS